MMNNFLILLSVFLATIIGLEISGQGDDSGDHVDFSEAITDPDTGLMCVFSKGEEQSKYC